MNNHFPIIADPTHLDPMERINSIMDQQAEIIQKMTPAVRLCERLVDPDDLWGMRWNQKYGTRLIKCYSMLG